MQLNMDIPNDSVTHQSGEDVNTLLAKTREHHTSTKDSIADVQSDEHSHEQDSFDQSFSQRYKKDIYDNSPELLSDTDKDVLTPDSPSNSRSPDFPQSLPSNISPYSSQFSVEEARLRFSLGSSPFKRQQLNFAKTGTLSQFNDDIIPRRYSLPDHMQDPRGHSLTPGHSSQPSSPPRSNPLSSSGVHSFRSPGHQPYQDLPYEEQDSRNLIPRIKEGLFFCHLCSFSGSTQAEFDNHMTIHFEHICPHCDYKSRTEGRLKRHIKDFHTEDPDGGYGARTMPGRPKVFRCKQCEYSTTEKIDFWTHSRSHIKEDKLLQCPRCPFVTEYKHHLEYHLRNHFGSKPFKCPKCNYACVNKSMLNSHMKSHTNVYQYRCADCTYATKYCHSLKLHLRKYNHKPAAVLNSDGSLPQGVDATASGLSLLAKRGPPRGPRGPRKDKLETGASNPLPIPPAGLGPLPGLPTMMSPFWPMLHNQLQGRMPHPLGFGQQFSPALASLPPLGMKVEDMKLSPGSQNSAGSNSLKCSLCSFIGTSREVLTSHMVKVHASENQDLFSMFGLSSESLLEDRKKRMGMLGLNMKSASRFDNDGQRELSNMKKENSERVSPNIKTMPGEFDRMKMSPFAHLSSSLKDEGIDILKQMTLKFGSGPVDLKRKLPPSTVPAHASSMASSLGTTSMVSSADSPLDLTKPRSPPAQNQGPYNPLELYRGEDADGSSEENSVYSNDISSPQPRKRSRKGKAFKLDTLCMKLQEKQGGVYDSEEGSEDDTGDMYKRELLPEEAEDCYQAETNGKDFNDNEDELDMKEQFSGDENESIRDRVPDDVDADRSGSRSEIAGDMKRQENDDVTGSQYEAEIGEFEAGMKNASPENSKIVSNDMESDIAENDKEEENDLVTSTYSSDDNKPVSPPGLGNQNRRKPIPAAIQRGADIAWKILNDPHIKDPSKFLKNGNNGHKLEMTALDKKLWIEAPECTSHTLKSEKGEYECPHCQISFGDCIMYTMHMGYHGYKDPYKCNMCGDTCKDRVEFFLHIARAAHN